jgi:formate hydrogenlyase subunit 4
MLARIGYNLLQVFVVLAFAPLVEGVASRLKEILQSKRGPSIFQPYRDIWKLLHKDEIVSEYSSWIFRAAPYVAFAAPIFVALLIPVLTRYPLFFALPPWTRPIPTDPWAQAARAWWDFSPNPSS